MTFALGFKGRVDHLTCVNPHLHVIDSSDSPLSVTPTHLLAVSGVLLVLMLVR